MTGKIVVYDPKSKTLVEVPRWSFRWVRFMLHMKLIDVLDWFRAWPLYWEGFKVGVTHGRESPGCGAQGIKMPDGQPHLELRFSEQRGWHYYCLRCSRPVAKSTR